jgi:hypothetical protein
MNSSVFVMLASIIRNPRLEIYLHVQKIQLLREISEISLQPSSLTDSKEHKLLYSSFLLGYIYIYIEREREREREIKKDLA